MMHLTNQLDVLDHLLSSPGVAKIGKIKIFIFGPVSHNCLHYHLVHNHTNVIRVAGKLKLKHSLNKN